MALVQMSSMTNRQHLATPEAHSRYLDSRVRLLVLMCKSVWQMWVVCCARGFINVDAHDALARKLTAKLLEVTD